MLLLVLAHRNVRGLVEQHVGGLEHGVGEQRDRLPLAVLAGLVLPLRHTIEPTHPRRAVEQPLQLGMGGHLGLVEQDRPGGIDPAGGERGGHLERSPAQLRRVVRHGDGVHVREEEQGALTHAQGVLHPHPVADCTEIVA